MAELPHSAGTVNVPPCQWLSLSPWARLSVAAGCRTRQTGGALLSFLRSKDKKKKTHIAQSFSSQQLTVLPTTAFQRPCNSRRMLRILLSAVFL